MVKRYITSNPDGTITITHLGVADPDGSKLTKVLFEISRTTDLTTHFDPATHTRDVIAAGISGHSALSLAGECEDTDLPTDRYFSGAWEWNSDAVIVDMTKARAIHLAEIRRVRNAELAAKDVPFMRAVEAGDASAQSTIGTEKQTLRDIPATFDITTGIDTPEQLKARWPAELPDR